MISFTVLGEARPAGSKRAFALRRRDGSLVTRPGGSPVINVTDDNAKSKGWKAIIAWSAREASGSDFALLRGPLEVSLTFHRPRPKGHFTGSGALSKKGRESIAPISKPDVLKLARGAEDALTGVIYADDAQIVSEHLKKLWGEPARLEVTITEISS